MMRWKKLKRIYEKNRSDLMGLVLRRYPEFILSDRENSIEKVPVFTFHQLTSEIFEPLLRYLAENGYSTLNSGELYEYITSDNFKYNKEVVLTFDDGHKSLYDIGYPLLKKYGFKGIVFIIAGLIKTNDKRPSWEAIENPLCSWKEIKEMHESGIFDFQAHSMYHNTIYTSPKIIDYVTPATELSFLQEALFPIIDDEEEIKFPDSFPLGTPIYESDYRYGNNLKYFDSIKLRHACQTFVKDNGGEMFFKKKGWKKQLKLFVRNIFNDSVNETRYESFEEKCEAIRGDLRKVKHTIEEKLPGHKVTHLCFPWFTADETTVNISGDEGYITNFWGGFIPKFAKDCREPLPIKRYNPIYIWRLPGKNRKSISEVVYNKISGMIY